MNTADPIDPVAAGICETHGDDAVEAADDDVRAAANDGADPLANLLDRVRTEGPAVALATPVIAALASMRNQTRDRYHAFVEALRDAAVDGGKRLPLTELRAALDAHDRARRAQEKVQKRREAAARAATADDETGLPVVALGFDLAGEANACIAALGACDNLYQRGGELVRMIRSPGVPELAADADDAERAAHDREVRRSPDAGAPVVASIPAATVEELLASTVEFRRGDRRVNPPPGLPVRVIARRTYDPSVIRPLLGIVGSPVMLRSGDLLTVRGYDRSSGLYLDDHGPPVEVPEHPTHDDARAAAGRLAGLFADFIFAGNLAERRVSIAGTLAAILTPLARPAVIGPVPGFLWHANDVSAGKTLAASACGAIVTGRALAARPWSGDESEQRKMIGALSLAGLPVALIDNVRDHIAGGALEAVLTSDTYADRILGVSSAPEVPWRTTLYLTGNHATVSPDVGARLRWVTMVGRGSAAAGDGVVGARVYRHPRLIDHVIAHRAEYLRDALTVLRAHLLADRPAAATVEKYEAWAGIVSSAVAWAYGADPAAANTPAAANRDRGDARAVVAAWCVALRGERGRITLSALRDRILRGEPRLVPLRDALADFAGVPDLARVTPRSLGMRLARIVGRSMAAPWDGSMRIDTHENRAGTMEYTAVCDISPPIDDERHPAAPVAHDDGDDHPARSAAPSTEAQESWPS